MSKHWEPCPRCGSNKVNATSKGTRATMLFLAGFCSVWVGLILWPILPLSIGLMIASPIYAIFGKGKKSCQDCKYIWKIEKKKESRASV